MLASERHGSGEPLVLVHGVTHRRQAWYPVLDRLTDQREVILVDLPGHGESPDLDLRGRSVDDTLRAEFQAFLADQGLERPHVAGNSLGGLIALSAGAEGDARSVTALSPAGFWENTRQFGYTRQIFEQACAVSARLGSRTELLARTRAGRTVMYGTLVAHPGRVSPDQARGDVRAFLRARKALRVLLDAASPFEREISPDVPVTIAWAARDLVLPLWQAQVARRRLPHAEHLTLRGVGHVPMTDKPTLVADILLQGSAAAADAAHFADTVDIASLLPAHTAAATPSTEAVWA
ncbi:alpha/beta fold hydrolase [uncultured Jatrophihabitans sp.]|uniref:alpha/beta fold hydrolase n=1 Tax=uncultured Jatrophihabitans sp. TaxID=1610747 RepID=UPI0035CB62B0